MIDQQSNNYTKKEIQMILAQTKFAYHRVDLPYDLHTPGRDRRPTAQLIFQTSLRGKSILDIGCALGALCFEAEKRGAHKIIGVELDESRYSQALLLKKILNSKVDFIKGNILQIQLEEKMDYVLLLNVLHHSPEPFQLLRYLVSVTNEKLIIEFPTFSDPKFRQTRSLHIPWLFNQLPLIGVSSLRKQVDQTFVFSPMAIKQVLSDHMNIQIVEIIRSPIKGRKIVICSK